MTDKVTQSVSTVDTRNIFLIGNPNSGKTSLFNAITGDHLHVGNWPGVTVERLEGITHTANGDIHLTDLPGTYSLTPATPEEAVVLTTLNDASRGTVLNVVDSTNMVRNLFLTTQLIEIGITPIICLNCYDSFTKQGGLIDLMKFTSLSGCDAYPTVARNSTGIPALIEFLSQRNTQEHQPEKHSMLGLPKVWFNYAKEVLTIQNMCWETATATQSFEAINALTKPAKDNQELEKLRQQLANELSESKKKRITPTTLACELAEDRYHRIEKMVMLCAKIPQKSIPEWQQKLDRIFISKFFGIPVFALLMAFVFWTTFVIGQYPMNWLKDMVNWLASCVENNINPGLLRDLVVEASIKPVGSVLVFVPNILILFFWIVLLEDSGYMSRAAFIVDSMMKSMGLQGRAFIPMVMGLGCNVPAIMATRIIDSKFQRRLTMFLIPMVSCSARLPVLVLLCGTFFPNSPSLWMFLLFFINLVVLLMLGHFTAVIFKTTDNSPFLLEMPPYRLPTPASIWNMLKDKTMHFIEKAGTIVLAGSIVMWALSSFPRNIPLSFDYQQSKAVIQSMAISDDEKAIKLEEIENQKAIEESENRYLGRLGKALQPIMEPFGFTWRETVSLIPGFLAKESVVSTLSVLYLPYSNDLGEGMRKNGMTQVKAFSFMLFTLLYVPCIATLGVLWKESGSTKFTLACLISYFTIAYGISFSALKIGNTLANSPKAPEEIIILIISAISAWTLIYRLINGLRGKICSAGCGGRCNGNCSVCNSDRSNGCK